MANRLRTQAVLHVLLIAGTCLSTPAWAQPTPAQDALQARQDAAAAVIGVSAAQLEADYWIERARHADRVIYDAEQLATQNVVMLDNDPNLVDLAELPTLVEAEQVRAWVEARSVLPEQPLYDVAGKQGSARAMNRLVTALDLQNIPQTQVTRFGLVVRRADLRTFPTHLRVFNTPDDTDIDRFQEDALFPGTPVAVVHESRDGRWFFVVSQRYSAWIERDRVAIGERDEVLAYARRTPYLVVTGATAHTVFTPEAPAVSDVQLEMGSRLPLATDVALDQPLHGQVPYFGHVVELPVRGDDGSLSFAQAMVPRSQDVATAYLPYTRANLIGQAFKFLGERYGWGHSYNARDCSGFVSEVYRSLGVLLPRNTSAQAVSPALNRIAIEPGTSHAERVRLLRDTEPGDLVYIPGHVMMVVGHVDGDPYVIHDTAGMSLLGDDGRLQRLALNGVVVTPLLPMRSNAETSTIDRITNIQRVRP
ncbi:SH3 domain-containing protein [Luteimonas sp. BDR2-5]|uniref:C40 family peptidase n=1 Tax=Proluteimonas luteida TaxID=2878685 RepID=UPI001E512C87|nr:SH3 domain-containing protein [Luteimonas sp. BDR2-5]MCD9027710.1 SH3 domain-containing protein [Luteimonas sp. BDR2-5]